MKLNPDLFRSMRAGDTNYVIIDPIYQEDIPRETPSLLDKNPAIYDQRASMSSAIRFKYNPLPEQETV